MSKLRRYVLYMLMGITGTLLLALVLLNLPLTQRFAAAQVNQILSSKEVPIHVDRIRKILPGSLRIQGITMAVPGEGTLIYAGELQARIRLVSLLGHKVILKEAELDAVHVDLSRSRNAQEINLAEAFQGGSKRASPHGERSSAGWEISVRDGNFTNIRFQMIDSVSGILIREQITKIVLEDFNVSLGDQEIYFRSLFLDQARGALHLMPGLIPPQRELGSPWNLGFQKLSVEDLEFEFSSAADGLQLKTTIGKGNVRANFFDLVSKTAHLRRVELDACIIAVLGASSTGNNESIRENIKSFPWDLSTERLEVRDSEFNPGSEIAGVIRELNLQLADLILDENQAGLKLRELAFETEHGFSLRKMNGSLEANADCTRLQLDIRTGLSRISLMASAEEAYKEILSSPGGISRASLQLEKSHVSLRDLAGFAPGLEEWPLFGVLSASQINGEGSLQLEDRSLELKGLSISQADHFHIALEGILQHIHQFPEAEGNLDLQVSLLDREWLEDLAVASGLSDTLADLKDLRMEGSISGSLLSPDFQLHAISSLGAMDAGGSVDLQKELFTLSFSIRELALDELFRKPELGSFTGAGEIKGRGFSMEELMASYYLQLDSMGFKGYSYRNSQFTGNIQPGSHDLQMLLNDPAIKGDIKLDLDLTDSSRILNASGVLRAQLDELRLYGDTLEIQTMVDGRFTRRGEELHADLNCRDMTFSTPDKTAELKDLTIRFETDSTSALIHADADFLHAGIGMVIPLDELDSLGKGYRNYFASFRKASHIVEMNRVSGLPVLDAEASVSYHELLDIFMGDSSLHFTDLEASIRREADQNTLHALIRGKDLSYKALKADRIYATITDTAGSLKLELLADSISLLSGPDNRLMLHTNTSNREMLASLSISDYRDLNRYHIDLSGRIDSNRIVLEIPDRRLTLNNANWQLEGQDLLTIDLDDNTILPSLNMKHGSSFLRMDARKDPPFISYTMDLNQVDLASLIRNDIFSGAPAATFTGVIKYRRDGNSGKEIDTELSLSNLSYSDQEYEDVKLSARYSGEKDKAYQFDLHATSDSLNIRVKGDRTEAGESEITGDFTNLPLVLLEPHMRKYISDLGGSLSGDFLMSSPGGPEHVSGSLMFRDAKVRVNMLNSVFRIPDQEIELARQKAVFKQFTILDTLNKALQLDGTIDLVNLQNPVADLNISSSKLQVMSFKERSRAAFGGNVFVDSRISIKGPLARPGIAGKIHLAEGTEIYYHHREDLRMTETEKLVNFVEHATSGEESESPPPLSGMGRIGGSSIGTVIEIDPSTMIHITLARRMFDIYLDVKGGGNLQYNMLNEQMALSGSYEIRSGTTFLKLVGWPNKSFSLAKGGYLRWDGMVDNPELYLEAENKVSTSYLNPIDNRSRDIDFFVILRLTGYLSDLNVEFKIRTPDQYVMSVINTLSPEEQMRQAIWVLLFETIDLPGISSSTAYVTQQVNQILSSQLNQFTRSAIKGVDISFGLDTYDQSSRDGGKEPTTTLSYEVRKSFLNNRAQVEFSGRLKDVNQASSSSEHSLNNLSFEYALDSAASKYLKIYNEQSYDDVFEGEVIKTGIGFSYKKRYRTLRDIFRRKK